MIHPVKLELRNCINRTEEELKMGSGLGTPVHPVEGVESQQNRQLAEDRAVLEAFADLFDCEPLTEFINNTNTETTSESEIAVPSTSDSSTLSAQQSPIIPTPPKVARPKKSRRPVKVKTACCNARDKIMAPENCQRCSRSGNDATASSASTETSLEPKVLTKSQPTRKQTKSKSAQQKQSNEASRNMGSTDNIELDRADKNTNEVIINKPVVLSVESALDSDFDSAVFNKDTTGHSSVMYGYQGDISSEDSESSDHESDLFDIADPWPKVSVPIKMVSTAVKFEKKLKSKGENSTGVKHRETKIIQVVPSSKTLDLNNDVSSKSDGMLKKNLPRLPQLKSIRTSWHRRDKKSRETSFSTSHLDDNLLEQAASKNSKIISDTKTRNGKVKRAALKSSEASSSSVPSLPPIPAGRINLTA